MPFTEEQIQWLMDNLSIELEELGWRYDDSRRIRVSLKLNGAEISYDSVSI